MQGKVRYLGISNIYDLSTLQELHAAAEVKPAFVQNRFCPKTHYDAGKLLKQNFQQFLNTY